jgi:hypothetical protein
MMNDQSDTKKAAEQVPGESERQVRWNSSVPSQPRYLLVAWILLLLLGVLFLFASLSDLLADVRTGLPSDHLEAFRAISGMTWSQAQVAAPGITHFVTELQIAYAVHELVFGVLFLIIVAIPFRQRARWAWWACWVPVLANLTYTFTIGHYGTTTLVYSLIADVALPVLLLLHIPAFFGRARRSSSP